MSTVTHIFNVQGEEFIAEITPVNGNDVTELEIVHRTGRSHDRDTAPKYALARRVNNNYYDSWKEGLFDPRKVALKATINNVPIAFAIAGEADRGDIYDELHDEYGDGLCELHQIYCDYAAQGTGTAQALYLQIVSAMIEREYTAMCINMMKGNEKAGRFYEKMGASVKGVVSERKGGEPTSEPIDINCTIMVHEFG